MLIWVRGHAMEGASGGLFIESGRKKSVTVGDRDTLHQEKPFGPRAL